MVYYPQNVNLTLHTLALLPSAISVILQIFFSLIATYNILYLLTFILSGTGTYLFVNLITKNKIAAFIAGMIFAYNPYIFAHAYAGHFNLLNTWAIPFFAYFLFKSIDDGKFKNTIYASLILVAQSYTDFHYLLYLVIFSLLFYIWQLIIGGDRFIIIRKILMGFSLWFILVLPILIPTYQFYKNNDYHDWLANEYHPQKASFENTDLASYYNFSVFHPIFGKNYLEKIKQQTGGISENNVFLGYTVIILSLLGLVFSKDGKKYFWLVVLLIFFSLSLGNSLQINGKIYQDLPFFMIKKNFLPELDIVASRFIIMVYLSLAVLTGYFIKILLLKAKSPKLRYFISVIIFTLIIFEYFPTLAIDKLETSPFYRQMATEKSAYNLVVAPETSRMDFYQTIHGKNLVGGYTGRRIHEYYLDYYSDIAGMRVILLNSAVKNQDLDREAVLNNFHKFKIKYIIIDRKVPFAQRDYLIDYLENKIMLPKYHQDELVNVYEIK